MRERGSFDRVHFVLVEPKGDGNIGSVCRVLKNMGFSNLILVNPVPFLTIDGYRMAASAKDLLDRVVIRDTLDEVLSDFNFVVCTTGKTGKAKRPVFTPQEVAEMVTSMDSDAKVAIVFGREDRGLENWELRLGYILSTIPTSPDNPSLNLSHAVLVYAYELFKAFTGGRLKSLGKPATFKEMEGFYGHLKSLLERVGYLDPQNPERMMDVLRRIFGRAFLDSREVRILRGIIRKVENALERVGGRDDTRETKTESP